MSWITGLSIPITGPDTPVELDDSWVPRIADAPDAQRVAEVPHAPRQTPAMNGSEKLALLSVGASLVAELTEAVAGTHERIIRRLARLLPPVAGPLRLHRLAVGVSCAAIQTVATFTAGVSSTAAKYRDDGQESGNRKRLAISAGMAAAIGDQSLEALQLLMPVMGIRVDGHPVALEREILAAAFPRASGRVAIFIHGMGNTERVWQNSGTIAAEVGRSGSTTNVFLRYNTGRPVSENGELLSLLLERLVEQWPQRIMELAFVAHSMGGLVVRSAGEQAISEALRWTGLVSHVFYLGTPHHGSLIEVGASKLVGALERFPETEPIARLANRRSAGIKDMRAGSVAVSDCRPGESGAATDKGMAGAGPGTGFISGAKHHLIAGSTLPPELAPVADVIGDIIVPLPSATARKWRLESRRKHRSTTYVIRSWHRGLIDHPEVAGIISSRIG